MTQNYHKPVLVQEVLNFLDPQKDKIYIDVTFGGGGHTRAILKKEPNCKVIAIDWDQNAIEQNGPKLKEEFGDRITLIWGNFANLIKILKKANINAIDGILADFGTSQFQITNLPGFSFQSDTKLDMRMSPSHGQLTAYDIINKFSADKLEEIFFNLGEERHSKKIVRAIVEERRKNKIRTTADLSNLIVRVIGRDPRKKIHPATKVFQALRIYVNSELENIKSFLTASLNLLNQNGRIVCISFHSLEDRIVKQFFKENICKTNNCLDKCFNILTKKVVQATQKEIKENPSSRSAKLRAAQVCLVK